MTTMTDTQATTITDDTLEILGRHSGNSRAAYWQAVDRAEFLPYLPGKTAEEVAAANRDVARLLTIAVNAEAAFEAYRAALNARSHSTPGVVFLSVEEYELSWTRVVA